MAYYCEKADLEQIGHPKLVTRWADDDGDGVLSTDEVENVTAAIAWAYNRINRKLTKRFSVPFSPVPGAIADINIVLALYRLAWRYSRAEAASMREEFEEADKALDEMAEGKQNIPGVSPRHGNAIESTTEDAEPDFSRTQ
ncbi:MAG: DUF1320 domain-containing protein [Planctomycetes bacterium]|nr:DUF1320 domain-containing protein [Planctomycetota bacterium]